MPNGWLAYFLCSLILLESMIYVKLLMWLFALTAHSFQQNMAAYQNLITQSMYDKQLDSGRGTLLHLCDDVIQQEVSWTLD